MREPSAFNRDILTFAYSSRFLSHSLDKAEDLCRKKKPEKAIPFLMKALEDPNNLDAAVQLAFVMPNMDMSLNVLEDTEKKGNISTVGCEEASHW